VGEPVCEVEQGVRAGQSAPASCEIVMANLRTRGIQPTTPGHATNRFEAWLGDAPALDLPGRREARSGAGKTERPPICRSPSTPTRDVRQLCATAPRLVAELSIDVLELKRAVCDPELDKACRRNP
jgi:hypothetical protein